MTTTPSNPPLPTPLASASNSLSLNELIERDPLSLTAPERKEICRQLVLGLREEREVFLKEDAAAKTEGRRVKTTKKKAGARKKALPDLTGLNLSDLDLKL